jgi:hypothetical protein
MISPSILTFSFGSELMMQNLRDGPSQDVESSYEGYGIRTLKVS